MSIAERIVEEVNLFIAVPAIKTNFDAIKKKNEKIVIINNSFMFRDGVKTNKNKKYLGFDLSIIPVTTASCFVIEGFDLKSDYKIIPKDDPKILSKSDLETAINEEKSSLGEMMFVLMGEIDENVELTEEIDHDVFKRLTYKPTATEEVKIQSDQILCKSIDQEEALWNSVENELTICGTDSGIIKSLKETIGATITKLKNQIYLNLLIPTTFESSKKYFLELISDSIKEQVSIYQSALEQSKSVGADHQQGLNEVLRVAYNFTDDSDTLLRLITSICDLKPLLLWLSFFEHYSLTETIKSLPWQKQDTKASLKTYANTVKKARNKAFHRLIPFSKSFLVRLPDNSIRDASLRIFSEFGSKSNSNRLDYKDKELVDVLMEFTRTSEEVLSENFWEKNLSVLKQTIKVLDKTALCIRMIR